MAFLKPNLLLLMAIVVASMEFQYSMAETHLVGDRDEGWRVPNGRDDFYIEWSRNHTFKVNDELVFGFAQGFHTVAEVTKEAYDNCDKRNPISLHTYTPTYITLTSTGNHYYICTENEFCKFNMKLAIKVSA